MRGLPKPSRARIIAGPGTEISDSIDMDVPEGTYILPADTTQAVAGRPRRDRGLNFARENPLDPASQKGRGLGLRSLMDIPISVSDGETEVPPETVAQIGAQVLDVVRNQTHDFSKGLNFAKAPARESQMIAGRGLPGFNGQPRLFFRDGGLVEDEERRRNSFSDNSAPGRTTGIMQTPEMAEGQRRQQEREGMADRITQTREGVGGAIRSGLSALATGGAAAESGLAAGQAAGEAVRNFVANTTFDDRLPGQARRDAARAEQQSRQNAQWVDGNPEQAQAAQQFGQDVADQTYRAGTNPLAQMPVSLPAQPPAVEGDPSAAISPLATTQAAAPAPASAGQNLAPELTRNALAQMPVTSVSNRIVRDGNSFSANTPIREGATIGSTDTLVGRQQDGGQPMARINSYDGRSAMESNLLASQIHQQTRLENSNPNYLNVVRDSGRSGLQGELNRQENKALGERQAERRGRHQQRIAQGQQQLNQAMQQRRNNTVAADERLYTRQQDQIAEQRNQLGDSLTRQQIDQGEMSVAQQRQLRDLSTRMTDPSLSASERAQAQRDYQTLTTTGSDTLRAQSDREAARQRAIVDLYRQYSNAPPMDSSNNPIPFEQWALPALQAMEQGGPAEDIPDSTEGMQLVGTKNGVNIYRDARGRLFEDD